MQLERLKRAALAKQRFNLRTVDAEAVTQVDTQASQLPRSAADSRASRVAGGFEMVTSSAGSRLSQLK